MANLEILKQLTVDFYDKKYISVNTKRFDESSRFLLIKCTNQGEFFPITRGLYMAFVRYRKADDLGVFRECTITPEGKIKLELSKTMLAAAGNCYADLMIFNKGDAEIDVDTGVLKCVENAAVLSTMTFCINVADTALDNAVIESSEDYSAFNKLILEATANYQKVVMAAKSWAVGDSGIPERAGIEDTDNAKYYSDVALDIMKNVQGMQEDVTVNTQIVNEQTAVAIDQANAASASATASANSANASATSATQANNSAIAAKTSETNAKNSETHSKTSETNAATSEQKARTSEINAATSETNARQSELNAVNNANKAQSYAVGGTGTRANEDNDNAHYYYEAIKNIVIGLDSGFIPMGTISFAELATADKLTGYVYNISDDFVTDNTFREGAGKSYTAGVNVYCTANGYWDCLGGASAPTATVAEVKGYLGI